MKSGYTRPILEYIVRVYSKEKELRRESSSAGARRQARAGLHQVWRPSPSPSPSSHPSTSASASRAAPGSLCSSRRPSRRRPRPPGAAPASRRSSSRATRAAGRCRAASRRCPSRLADGLRARMQRLACKSTHTLSSSSRVTVNATGVHSFSSVRLGYCTANGTILIKGVVISTWNIR